MSERTCGNCRWWKQEHSAYGYCYRNAPTQGPLAWVRPEVEADATCGQWADATITPEQEEKRELVRRFAVALTSGAVFDGSVKQTADTVWIVAQAMADAEPGQ